MNTDRVDQPRIQLPDGSTASVWHSLRDRHAIISRFVGGAFVWGQVFSTHEGNGHVDRVLADMAENPAGYRRWWITDPPEPTPEN